MIRVKEETGRADLKLNITKIEIMTYGLITSWQIEGEKMAVVTDFLLLDSKITVDVDYSNEIRRQLLLGKKAENLDSVLKSRDITPLTKVHIVKDYDFPSSHVWFDSWTVF